MDKRILTLAILLKRLIDGEQPTKVASDYAKDLGRVSARELALAEEHLAAEVIEVETIQRANELHTELVVASMEHDRKELQKIMTPGHPAFVFAGENEGIKLFMKKQLVPDLRNFLETLAEKDRLNLLNAARELQKISRHYERKENLFFPYLEKTEITAPPKVMWGVDDIIKNLLRLFVEAIEQEPILPSRVEMIYTRLSSQIESMIEKENKILLPMLATYMSEEDWFLVARESSIIGYVFNKGIEGASNSDALTWLEQKKDSKRDSVEMTGNRIKLPSGHLTLHELNTMLNTLPTDLTFIDSNDRVQYYSEGKHQVFTRTRTIIGRDVYLCHPPQLVPVIKELIESFRSGTRDEKTVLMRKGSRLDLVRYYAVRDNSGEYIGTVEVTEEISGIVEQANAILKS